MARGQTAAAVGNEQPDVGLQLVTPNRRKAKIAPAAAAWSMCRSMGHQWQHVPGRVLPDDEDSHAPPSARYYGSVGLRSRCGQCATERTKWFDRKGNLGPTNYRYPDGYQLTTAHGDAVPTKVEWRKTFYLTLFND